jgi:signal transduction histidine kinase
LLTRWRSGFVAPIAAVAAAAERVRFDTDRAASRPPELEAAPIEGETFDLSDLVVERVESARSAAEARLVRLRLDAVDAIRVLGDVVLIRQVVDNLVETAIKYTPADGQVVVALRPRPGRGSECR